jgi:acyl dehydratase
MSFEYKRIKSWPINAAVEEYGPDHCTQFARGIGAGLAPDYAALEQPYLEGKQAFPMMCVILGGSGALWTNDPATGIDWRRMLHAEEAVTLHRPLQPRGRITAQFAVDEIYDKGVDRGALMYESAKLTDAEGEQVATVNVTMLMRGNGGCGGAVGSPPKPYPMPQDREPDAVIDLPTPDNESATYKLPDVFDAARAASGPAKSMLRGVCAFGIAGRAVILKMCAGEARSLLRLGLRYTAPVFTGETLRTQIWRESDGKLAFSVRSLETDTVVMNNGYAQVIPVHGFQTRSD